METKQIKKLNDEISKILTKAGQLSITLALKLKELKSAYLRTEVLREDTDVIKIHYFYKGLEEIHNLGKRKVQDLLNLAEKKYLHSVPISESKLILLCYQNEKDVRRLLKAGGFEGMTYRELKNYFLEQSTQGFDSDNYHTPIDFFNQVQEDFGWEFTTDPCSSPGNRLGLSNYYAAEDGRNGLAEDWSGFCWVNPPYSQKALWVEKALYENLKRGVKSVMLLPSSTDSDLFHLLCEKAAKIVFVKGRVSFTNDLIDTTTPAFASVLVLIDKQGVGECEFETYDTSPSLKRLPIQKATLKQISLNPVVNW